MKRLIAIVVTAGITAAGVGLAQAQAQAPALPATPGASASTAQAEQELLKAEKERFEAMVKADAGALNKLLGEELSYTHSNAQVQDKAGFIADIRSKAIRYISIGPDDIHVKVFGTTAVVTGSAVVHVIENGNDQTLKIRYTDVQVNRRGEWQMVAWQAARLP